MYVHRRRKNFAVWPPFTVLGVKGEMPESGGAKLLKWRTLSARRRIRPIFVFGDAFFRPAKGKVTGGRWLVAGRRGSTCYWQDNSRGSWRRGWRGKAMRGRGGSGRGGVIEGAREMVTGAGSPAV